MQIRADENYEGKRADSAIASILKDFSRSKIQKMFEEGLIKINSKPAKAAQKLKYNDIIEISDFTKLNEELKPENIPLDIIFEDDCLLVINKPKGMLTHPTPQNREGTLVNALLGYGCKLSNTGDKDRPGIVHRLDKNTSGLILIAKTNKAHLNLQKQIQEKEAKRKYLAVVYGVLENSKGKIDKPLVHNINKTVKMGIAKAGQGLKALTYYKVLERYDGLTLVELELKTGRTHQIRAHMASIGHPVYGDTLYGAKGFKSKLNLKTQEQLLMSYYLSFTHPKYGEIMKFQLDENQYDEDFKKFFKIASKEKEGV